MKRATIGATLLIAFGWFSQVGAVRWPFSNSDSTWNSYGQYQYGTVGNKTSRYMHPGLDIPRPVVQGVKSQAGFAWVWPQGGPWR